MIVIIQNKLELLGILQRTKRGQHCSKCGRKFPNNSNAIHVCSRKCSESFEGASVHRRNKAMNWYMKNPNICGMCRKNPARFETSYGIPRFCKLCGQKN